MDTPVGANEQQLRSELGLGAGGIADLAGLCEGELGVDVAVEVLPEGPDGLLGHDGAEVGLMMIRAGQPAGQRFTLAHELGHLGLGDGDVVIVEADIVGSDDAAERDANEFASEFLMPRADVERVAGDGPVDIAAVGT